MLGTYSGHNRSAEPGSPEALEAPTGAGTLDRTDAPCSFALGHVGRPIVIAFHERPIPGVQLGEPLLGQITAESWAEAFKLVEER